VVAATALLRCAPLLLAGLAVTAGLGLARGKRRLSPRAVAILVVLAGLAVLAAGYEAGWRGAWDARCGSLLGDDLELPPDGFGAGVAGAGAGPLLVVGAGGAGGEEDGAKPADIPHARTHGGRLLLAADRRLAVGRLEETLRDCGRAGWHRFGLLLRPAGQDACIRQRRVAGVCLDRHPARLPHLPFETSHLGRRMRPPPGVVANLVVEPDRVEISFAGFGVEADILASLGRVLPDRHGEPDLAGLLDALAEAKRHHPDSTTMLILAHPELVVAKLCDLMGRIRTAGATPAFPVVRLGPLLR